MKMNILNNLFGEWLMKIECILLLSYCFSVFSMDQIHADHPSPPIQKQTSTSTTQDPCASTSSADTSIIKQKVIGSTSIEKGQPMAKLKTVKSKVADGTENKLIQKLYEYLLEDSFVEDRIDKIFTDTKNSEEEAHKKLMKFVRQYEDHQSSLISLLKREFPKNDAEKTYGIFLGEVYSSAGDWINNKNNPTDFIRCIINASWIGDKYYPDVNDWGIYIHTLGGWPYVEQYFKTGVTFQKKQQAVEALKKIFVD